MHMTRMPCNFAGLLKFDDNGVQVDAAVLLLLQKLCSAFPSVGRQLLQHGAEDTLRDARLSRSSDVQQLIDATLGSITSAPMGGPTEILGLPAGTGATPWSSAAAAPGAPGSLPPMAPPIARPLELEFASAVAQQTPAVTAHIMPFTAPMPPSTSATFGWTPSKQVQSASGSTTPTPAAMAAPHTGVMDTVLHRGGGAFARGTPARPVDATPAHHMTSMVPARAAATAAGATGTAAATSYLSGDAQALVARMRAERSGAALPQGVVANLAAVSGVPADASDWLLAPVALSPTDEQLLFDLVARLKYLEDPGRIVAPALLVRA